MAQVARVKGRRQKRFQTENGALEAKVVITSRKKDRWNEKSAKVKSKMSGNEGTRPVYLEFGIRSTPVLSKIRSPDYM